MKYSMPGWAKHVFAPKTVGGVPVRYRVAYGGRGSSKSWAFARQALIRAGTERDLTVVCGRELQKSIKDSVHRLLIGQVKAMGLESMFRWDKTHLESVTGSEFLFYGLRHNAEEIKSLEGADIFWGEEARSITDDSMTEVFPTIRKPGSEIWLTYNPKLASDPVHHAFVVEGRAGAIVRKVNWSDNPWFPDVLRADMEDMRRINPKLARRVWDGEIVEIGSGDYFPSDKVNYLDEAPEYVVPCRGWDLAASSPSDDYPDPDYTAGVKIGIDQHGRVIVMDAIMEQVNAAAVRRLVMNAAVEDTAEATGIACKIRIPQDPGQAGKEQAESYERMLDGFEVVTPRITGDKEVRSELLSSQWHAGNVCLVRGDWNAKYLEMMNAFPNKDVHDDVVDASNDAYTELINPTEASGYTLANVG